LPLNQSRDGIYRAGELRDVSLTDRGKIGAPVEVAESRVDQGRTNILEAVEHVDTVIGVSEIGDCDGIPGRGIAIHDLSRARDIATRVPSAVWVDLKRAGALNVVGDNGWKGQLDDVD